jgi:hypothetical protein
MILYRVQHAETGIGPFEGIPLRHDGLLWEAGPTPRSEMFDECGDAWGFTMEGKRCAVHRPYLLTKWFPKPGDLGRRGFILAMLDVPDDACQFWTYQAVFDRDAATTVRTYPLPERWDDILDLLEREES